ncbi:MAG: hypothetical protein QM765_11180 [Myxococcales bacterium]
MTKTFAALAAALLAALPAAASAQTAEPTPDEIDRVLEYFNSGKGRGPILTGFKACTSVDNKKDSPTRLECSEEVSGPVKKGTVVHAWTAWFVPQGDRYDDIAVQFVHEGSLRATVDVSVTTAYRTRSYKSQALTKSGNWEIKVVRGEKVLASSKVVVE